MILQHFEELDDILYNLLIPQDLQYTESRCTIMKVLF